MRSSQQQSAQKSQDKATLPSGKAIVKSVLSGDSLCLAPVGKNKSAFEDPMCYLAYVSVPRVGNPNRAEEPFAYEAREAIREMVIGRKVDYVTEYMAGNRKAISVSVEGEDIATLLVTKSLAKVNERRANTPEGGLHDRLLAVQEEVSKKGKGVWNTDSAFLAKNTRQVVYFGEGDYKPEKIMEEANKEPRPLGGILEHVFGTTLLVVYIMRLKVQVKLNMVHLYTPKDTDSSILEEGKQFIEKMLLHRTVGVKLTRVDENSGILVGRIHFPQGDIACEVLKRGLAKLGTPKDTNFDTEYFRELKQAQLVGQSKRAGLFKNFDEGDLAANRSSVSDFSGKVVEIHSGDSLTVEKDSNHTTVRVFLSSVKAPSMTARGGGAPGQGAQQQQPESEPYAWQAKESLRKLAIGKKVRVEMEYDRVMPTRQGSTMTMNFGAVIEQSKSRNLAVMQLERGLVRTNVRQNGENASKYLEDLLTAEKKASDAKLCLHNTSKQPPNVIFADLTQNTKQAKEFEAMVMKRKERSFRGVVEYCLSGMRFKVRLEQEGRIIALNLLGIKTMAQDKNQPTLMEYANDAHRLAKTHLFQREVTVDLQFADKRGSFFGTLTMSNKTDFAVKLCEEGLAQTFLQGSSSQRPPSNYSLLEEAEENAKQRGIGIWGSQLNLMAQNQSGSASLFEPLQRVRVEMTDMRDATRFHLRKTDSKSKSQNIDDAMESFDADSSEELQKPIKKGTLCAALFSEDNKWYRARVIGNAAKDQLQVKFIDYGNQETVEGRSLRQLPAHLLAFEPQAMEARFAYLRAASKDSLMGKDASKYVTRHGLNLEHDAIMVRSDSDRPLEVILMEHGEEDWGNSLNAYMVAEGLAILEKYVKLEQDASVPDQVYTWLDFEEEARRGAIGLWQHGNAEGMLEDAGEDY